MNDYLASMNVTQSNLHLADKRVPPLDCIRESMTELLAMALEEGRAQGRLE